MHHLYAKKEGKTIQNAQKTILIAIVTLPEISAKMRSAIIFLCLAAVAVAKVSLQDLLQDKMALDKQENMGEIQQDMAEVISVV